MKPKSKLEWQIAQKTKLKKQNSHENNFNKNWLRL